MKCKIPEISWHNRDPVLSVDIQPNSNVSSNCYRLASGGTDAHVLIWYMKLICGKDSDIELDLAADLTRHQRAVNAVKWSPSGELLASGDDESVVFIWKQKSDSEPLNILDSTNEQDKEVWITLKILRGHMEDIYDLSWAPNSLYLVSGSVDNSAIIWDVQKGKSMSILKDHKGFVQGVAWDPKNQYIATLSTDRYLRIFDIQSKKVLYRVSKGTLPVPEDNNLHGKRMRLFHDDTLQTFFRRLSFTPDGKLLLTPAGVTDYDGCTRPLNTSYIFSRYGFRQPAIVLPCPDQYTVAVKCCPLLYKLRPFNAEKNPPVVPLPYRMIFAVATKSSIYFYDTQQKQPFALISNIHYTRLTDITWSNDGRIVVVSSTDGFCSLITFERGELGEEYENSEMALEAALAQVTKKTKKQKDTEALPKSRKSSTEDTSLAKDNITVQKEPQLEKIVERENNEDDEKKATHLTTNEEGNEKETNEKNKQCSDSKQATPINIKKKPNSTEIEINDKKSNLIPITPKSVPEEKLTTNNSENRKATPIAIKRKPGPATTDDSEEKVKELNNTKQAEEKTPTKLKHLAADDNIENKKEEEKTCIKHVEETPPKHKSNLNNGKLEENQTCTENAEEPKSPKVAVVIPSKVLAAEIIIDKEILSSDEKFESPEKKSRPATPISIRRHLRTPNSNTKAATICQTPTSPSNIMKAQLDVNNPSPLTSLPKEKKTPRQDKKATPIAVRRTPRSIITTPPVVNTTSLVEEAMDAWPLKKESNLVVTPEITAESSKKTIDVAGITPLPISETTCERTEDIHLVYEETIEETPINESLPKPLEIEEKSTTIENKTEDTPKQHTPSCKTPRRVALKTISTPKSKKKLLD